MPFVWSNKFAKVATLSKHESTILNEGITLKELHSKYNTEFTHRLLLNSNIFYEIFEACGNKFWDGCGSYLIDGATYEYCGFMYPKQQLLYDSVKNSKTVLEVGTYMGHSLLIMLLSNPTLKITCIDIDDTYSLPAITVLNRHFNNAIQFIHSDSLLALETLHDKFDFFHIDGEHNNNYVTNEFELIKNLSSNDHLRIIFDDQQGLGDVQNKIFKNYNVITTIKPECTWNNVYFEIEL